MRKDRIPLLIAATSLAALATWSGLVFSRGIGFDAYLLPGRMSIAAAVHPCEVSEPYGVKADETFEQAFAQAYAEHAIRCGLPQGFIALWISAAVWVAVVPLGVFIALRGIQEIRARRRLTN